MPEAKNGNEILFSLHSGSQGLIFQGLLLKVHFVLEFVMELEKLRETEKCMIML